MNVEMVYIFKEAVVFCKLLPKHKPEPEISFIKAMVPLVEQSSQRFHQITISSGAYLHSADALIGNRVCHGGFEDVKRETVDC